MRKLFTEPLFESIAEQQYHRKQLYREFLRQDPKALITLFFMEHEHCEYYDETDLLAVRPPDNTVQELMEFYEKYKDQSWEDSGHPNYDVEINQIYNLWRYKVKGNASSDQQIELMRELFYYFTLSPLEINQKLKEEARIRFRNNKKADLVYLHYPLLEESKKQQKELSDRYMWLLETDLKSLIILWIMERIYIEEPEFPSPYTRLILAAPPSEDTQQINEFYHVHKRNGGYNFDKEVEEIYFLFKRKLEKSESISEFALIELSIIMDQVLYEIDEIEMEMPF